MPDRTTEILARLQREPIVRTFTLTVDRASDIDEDARIVRQVAIVSDKPVEHWFGLLRLSMKPKAIRSARLDSGRMAGLWNHNRDDQRFVIENPTRGSDGIIRADFRFSRSQQGMDLFHDVVDGIKQNVSLGFAVYHLELEKQEKGQPDQYFSEDWEPLEASMVSIDADISVGVGRSLNPQIPETISNPSQSERAISTKEEKTMTPEEIAAAAAAEASQRAQETAAANANPALTVARQITEWGAVLGEPELARTHAAMEGASVETFMAAVRAKQPSTVTPPPEAAADVAARNGGPANVQLARSVYRGGQMKAFKGERGLEQAHRAGMFLLATLGEQAHAMQFCRDKGIKIERAHGGGTNALGGFLVPDEFENVMIDLRLQYGVFRANANVVPMTSDTKSRPRRTGGLTAYFRRSGTAATESTKSWDMVELVAKLCSVLTKYENELSDDAVISIGDDLVSEISYAFAQKEDECGFNGDGSSTYDGIVGVRNKLLNLSATRANIAGLQVASGNAWSEITMADMLGVVGKLPQFARRAGGVKWYCSSEFWANVLQRLALAVGGVTHAEVEGELKEVFLGKPVEICEAMPHTEANDVVPILYGNLAQAAMFGDRKGTSIEMTNSDGSDFGSGIMAIRGDTRFDINVHDVGNATGTAADKRPGPIVGLLTAAS